MLMFRYVYVFVLIMHSLIHLVGFAKAFDYRNIPMLTTISKPMGILWFSAAILFIAAACMLMGSQHIWWIAVLLAVIISELVIVVSWQDAKLGTIVNLLVLTGLIVLIFVM